MYMATDTVNEYSTPTKLEAQTTAELERTIYCILRTYSWGIYLIESLIRLAKIPRQMQMANIYRNRKCSANVHGLKSDRNNTTR
jgi:hypothetical protein